MSRTLRYDAPVLPVELARHVDRVCDEFEDAWAADGRPRPEDFLDRVPESARAALLRELILIEVAYRRRRGEDCRADEYAGRFPGLDPAWLAAAVAPPDPGPGSDAPTRRQSPHTLAAPAGSASPAGGRAFGDYELLRELGRGGMGVVYQAWQSSLSRTVALKMILAGAHAGPEELARFRAEAEAVARLQHPNIVQIYQVGEHDGRPYFALEYVEGGSLERKLAGAPRPPREAAALAETLARTVHYAHQRGIVHRDLKPANVLLTEDGTPKITDFGLAKILVGARGDPTQTGAVLGTPGYMAPEQASGRPREVGPAADVYALGAILYECLTGRPPFLGETPLDTLEQVRALDPIPPRQLQPKVPLDLETICLKCLRKEPGQRYGSALDLAEDLRRFLGGESIRARPVGATGRLWRWCRRKPAVAILATALAVALVAGFIGLTVLWQRADRHRIQAERERAEALTNLRLAREAADNYATRVSENLRLRQEDLRPLRKELLETVVPFYEKLVEGHSDDPEVQAERGKAYFRLGMLTAEIDDKAKAAALFEQAVAIFDQLARGHPDDPAYQKELARACNDLGNMYHDLREADRAERAYRQAVAVRERLAAKDPDDAENRCDLARHYHNLGSLYAFSRRRADAEEAFGHAEELLAQLLRDGADNREYQNLLAGTHLNRGNLYLRAADWAAAEKSLEACRGLAADLIARDASDATARNALGVALLNLGQVSLRTNRPAKARESYAQALPHLEKLAQDNPSVLDYQDRLATCHIGLGACHQMAREPRQAEEAYLRAVAIYEDRLAPHFAAAPNYQARLAEARRRLAALYASRGEGKKAVEAFGKALDALMPLAREHPDVDDYYASLAECTGQMLGYYQAAGQPARAEEACREAVALGEQCLRDSPESEKRREGLAFAYNVLAVCYDAQGKPEAAGAYQSAIRLREQLVADFPGAARHKAELARSYVNLGLLCQQQRRWDDAEEAFQKALPVYEGLAGAAGADPEDAAELGGCYGDMGLLMKDRDRGDEALRWYGRAVPVLEGVLKKDPGQPEAREYLRNALRQRADLLTDLGRPADAVTDYDSAARLAKGQALREIRIARARALALRGEQAQATREAQELAAEPALTADDRFSLAGVYSLSARAASKDPALAAPEREKLAEAYGGRALALLQRLHKEGYFKAPKRVKDLKTQKDLDAVRARDDFKALLTAVDEQAKAPGP
jgi:serine/threonine-protein kinase